MNSPSTAGGGPRHPTRVQIGLLAAAVFMAVTTELMPAGVLPWLSADLGVENERAGLLVTAYAFVVAATAVPLTTATMRWPRRRLIVTVLLGYAVSNVLMAIAGSLVVAGAARVVGGLSHAVLFSIVTAYAARLVRPDLVGRTVAVLWLGTALALLAGLPAGTSLGAATSWRWPFVVLAVLGVALAACAGTLLAPVESSEPGTTSLSGVVRSPGVARVAIATGLVMLGNFTAYTYVATLLLSAGFSKDAVGPGLLAHGLAGLAGLWWSARLADRRPRLGLTISLALLVCSLLGLALAQDSAAATVVALVGWGAAYGGLATFFNAAALRATPARDTATALINVAFNLGIGGGAVLGSLVIGAGGRAPALAPLAAGLVAVGLLVVLAGRRHAFPSGAAPEREAPGQHPS
ncbi:Predicted arabinose efflux permease, MFS family [Pedococcus dokdonensis]|uniref:Predicted arabinose efflux permease, MFS family n=1 Tax=Pedococcus dokdonensis TaxID=443156 RepID=A0A1H0TXN4_9MICO|nr:MFS transporter [Pedococcus dokdonensis]SDP58540.1 Predicted arabinose efflux permease, MFS family [Pedococcus dokdonensis]